VGRDADRRIGSIDLQFSSEGRRNLEKCSKGSYAVTNHVHGDALFHSAAERIAGAPGTAALQP
jgi:hypothetical protein